jgi:hypothetical protein
MGAVCLDGSPATYYMRNATTVGSLNKWVIYLEGGAWCVGENAYDTNAYKGNPNCVLESCEVRTTYKWGTTNSSKNAYDADYLDFDAITVVHQDFFNWDCSTSPTLCEFNLVWFRYCDGGSYSGNRSEPVITSNGVTLYYRGARILYSILDELLFYHGMDNATEVVLSGYSSGAVALLMHIDDMAQYIQDGNTNVNGIIPSIVGLANAGYFPMNVPYYVQLMQWVFTNQEISNDTMRNAGDMCWYLNGGVYEWRCMFAESLIPYLDTPVFFQQPTYDSYTTLCILNVSMAYPLSLDVTPTQEAYVQSMGDSLQLSLETDILDASFLNTSHFAFIDSCDHHGHLYRVRYEASAWDFLFDLDYWHNIWITGVDNTTFNAELAFAYWYYATVYDDTLSKDMLLRAAPNGVLAQNQPFRCDSCCGVMTPTAIPTLEPTMEPITNYPNTPPEQDSLDGSTLPQIYQAFLITLLAAIYI